MSAIPTQVRAKVRKRDGGRCLRCLMRGNQAHHRRGRAVDDGHQHCPCNIITLCGWGNHMGDHGWAHTNIDALVQGFRVSREATEPFRVPIFLQGSWVYLTCEGTTTTEKPEEGP